MTVSSNQRRYPAFPETMGSDNSIRSNPPKVGFSIRHAPTIGASRRNACQHGRMSLADEAKGLYHYNATDRDDVVVVVIGGQGSRYAYNTGSQITTETACHGQRLDDSNPLAMDRTLRFSTTFSDHPADAVQCKYAYDNPRVADWPFYESRGIRKDNDITGSTPDDRFSMPQISTCSKGTIVIDAAATYYDGKESPPPGFVVTGKPPGGRLPGSRNPPPTEWGEGDGWLARRVVATWDCCSGHGKTSVSIQ